MSTTAVHAPEPAVDLPSSARGPERRQAGPTGSCRQTRHERLPRDTGDADAAFAHAPPSGRTGRRALASSWAADNSPVVAEHRSATMRSELKTCTAAWHRGAPKGLATEALTRSGRRLTTAERSPDSATVKRYVRHALA